MKYYTYAYLREDGTPYYIGKGSGARINKSHDSVGVPPKERRIYLKQNLTEDQAFRHEIYMIGILGRICDGGILRNVTLGGDGQSGKTPWNKGIPMSEESKKKLSEKKKGKTSPRKGVVLSIETKKRISESRRGGKMSEEDKKIRSEKLKEYYRQRREAGYKR